MCARIAGGNSSGVQGQLVQGQLVPPPPGVQQQYVGPVPAGAMLPPGTVPGSIMPAAAGMMPGVVPGAVQVMGPPHQAGPLQGMTAAGAPAGEILAVLYEGYRLSLWHIG